eukprot:12415345-Karenia_brevis.AAC.1
MYDDDVEADDGDVAATADDAAGEDHDYVCDNADVDDVDDDAHAGDEEGEDDDGDADGCHEDDDEDDASGMMVVMRNRFADGNDYDHD